ncbi:MAG: response regulator, partial [Anaerolineae bacterium]|nr:response regulator [Anaerolineae bacterium]
MATRVLILNKQLVFAVTLKQALEQTGTFEVHPFTTAQAALEYLREHPQDVALVDFTLPGVTGTQLVQWLRATQSDLAIVASPRPADADAIIAGLGIQGMVNQPFTARDIIPLLQKAVDAVQQAGNDPSRAKTDQPPANRPVEDMPPPPPVSQYGKTRTLDDGAANVPPQRPSTPVGKTRILDDVEQPKPTPPYDPAYGRTRKLDEPPPPPSAPANYQTRHLDEPAVEEGDTPPVPTRDSDAMRQFLVTSGKPAIDSLFDDVLDVIDAEIASIGDEEAESEDTSGDPFKGMIKSLSRGEQTSRLPERQPPGTDFTYTSGMDAVLREIARTKTGTLPAVPSEPPRDAAESTFQKLAQEEPPMPALEDSGTVGDLMVGVTDHQFRNVLALLRGEDAYPTSTEAERAAIEEAFAGVVWPGGEEVEPPPTLTEEAALTQPPEAGEATKDEFREEFDRLEYAESFDDEAGDATVAQLILETALDESTPPGEFSINRLIDDIDARLSIHKLAIRGLPSWGQDTGAFRPVDAEGIREPDFLPADLPVGEMIVPELPQFESEDIDEGMFTTQPSAATREALESQAEQSSATIEIPDDWYTGETVASQPVSLHDAAGEQPVTAESEAIEDTSHLTDTSQWDEVTPVSGSVPVDMDAPEESPVLAEEEPVEPVWLDDTEFAAGETDTVFDGYGRFDDVPEYEDGYTAEEAAPVESMPEPEQPPQAAPPVYDENAWLKPLLQKPSESPEPVERVPAENEASEPPLTVWNEPEPEDSGNVTRPLDILPEIAESGVVSSWDMPVHEEEGSTTQPLTTME